MMCTLSYMSFNVLSAAFNFPSIQQIFMVLLGSNLIMSLHFCLTANIEVLRRLFFMTTLGLKRVATQILSPPITISSSCCFIPGLLLNTVTIFFVSSACKASERASCAGMVRLLTLTFVAHTFVVILFLWSMLPR